MYIIRDFMTLDIFIFSTFLALNLGVGLWYGRQVKTLREYAIGNKKFATGTITASIVSTTLAGGFLFWGLENTYTLGLQFIIPSLLGTTLGFLITARIVIVRMGAFLNNLSVAEAMGDLYGKKVQMITALSGICKMAGGIACQFNVIPQILSMTFGLEGPLVTLLTAGIIIAYSAFGGIRSVTLTDVLQFIVVCICIPTVASVMYHSIKEPTPITTVLATHPLFSFRHLKDIVGWNPKFIAFLSLLFFWAFPTAGIHPALFQRVAMATSIDQAKKSFTYSMGFILLIKVSIILIGIKVLANNPDLPPSKLVNYILATYTYPGLKGLLAIGVVALSMSTADSLLNTSAVLFVNDLIKPLQKIEAKQELRLARICSFLIGIFSICLAYCSPNLLQLLKTASAFYMPIYIPPLLLAILGFRSTPTAVLISMATGGITVVLWNTGLSYTGLDGIIPGMLTNFLVLFISPMLFPTPPEKPIGWVGSHKIPPLVGVYLSQKKAWKNRLQAISLFSGYAYCSTLLPKNKLTYTLFALYAFVIIYIPIFQLRAAWVEQFPTLHTVLLLSVLLPITLYLIYPALDNPAPWQPCITLCWPIGVGYLLLGTSTILLIINEFRSISLLIWISNLLFANLLLPWQVMLWMLGLSMTLACVNGVAHWEHIFGLADDYTLEFKVIYSVCLFVILLILLYQYQKEKKRLQQKKDYYQNKLVEYEQDRLHNLQYQALQKATVEHQEPLQYVKTFLHTLTDTLPDPKIAQKAIEQIDAFVHYTRNSFYYAMDYLRLNVAPITIDTLLDQLVKALQVYGLENQVHGSFAVQQQRIVCDSNKIILLLVTSLRHFFPKSDPPIPLFLTVQDTTLQYQLQAVPDPQYIRVLPAIAFILHTPNTPITVAQNYPGNTGAITIQVPRSVTELPQRKNARILDAHYGYSQILAGEQVLYVIPRDLRAIRPQVVDELPVIGEGIVENADSIAVESAFLAHIKAKTSLDLTLLQEVIDHIKRIHQGQYRKSGELFYTHPLTVARLVVTMTQDPDAIVAALLHDAVEDTHLTLCQVTYHYGPIVAAIVSKVTHLDPTQKKSKLTEMENQYQLAAVQDPRVVMVKLADRWHNMGTLSFLPTKRQQAIAQETLDFYVPLGRGLGLAAVDAVVEEIIAQCQAILSPTYARPQAHDLLYQEG